MMSAVNSHALLGVEKRSFVLVQVTFNAPLIQLIQIIRTRTHGQLCKRVIRVVSWEISCGIFQEISGKITVLFQKNSVEVFRRFMI